MNSRFSNMIILCLSISIIAVCSAQESTEYVKLNTVDDEKFQKQQESIEALMKQVGDMGMLVESYRRVIVNGITESNDICGFMENLSNPERDVDNSLDSKWCLSLEIKTLINI
jgi:adenine-specific DNA methylase